MKYTVEVDSDVYVRWYKEGTKILHREDGPAVEWSNGDKCWFKEDLLHRLDGPAIEYADGSKSYYVEDRKYSEEEFTNLFLNKAKSDHLDGYDIGL